MRLFHKALTALLLWIAFPLAANEPPKAQSGSNNAEALHTLDEPTIAAAAEGSIEALDQVLAELRRLGALTAAAVDGGTPDIAVVHGHAMLALLERVEPNNDLAMAQVKCMLATALGEGVDLDDAARVWDEFAVHMEALKGPMALPYLYCHEVRIGNLLSLGRKQEAFELLTFFTNDPFWQQGGSRDRATLHMDLAVYYAEEGRFGEAEPVARRAYDIIREDLREEHFAVGKVRTALAKILSASGQFEAAIPLIELTLDHRLAELGEDHPTSLLIKDSLAAAYQQTGEPDKALALFRDVYDRFTRTRGADSLYTISAALNLGEALSKAGRHAEAAPLLSAAHDGFTRLFSPTHPDTLKALAAKAQSALDAGDLEIASALISELASKRFASLESGHIERAPTWSLIGQLIEARSGSPSQAIFAYKQGINILQGVRANMQDLPDEAKAAFTALQLEDYRRLQKLLVKQGRFAEAEQVGRMIKRTEFVGFLRGGATLESEPKLDATHVEESWRDEFDTWIERPGLLATRLREARANGAPAEEIAAMEDASGQAYAAFRTKLGAWLADVSALQEANARDEALALNVAQSDRIQDLIADLGEDVALLQVVALPEAIEFFLITPDSFIHRRSNTSRDVLYDMIFGARTAVVDGYEDGGLEYLQKLHTMLFDPIAQDLADAGTKTIMLNLQGRIRYVPYAALHDGQRYVIEDYALARFSPATGTVFDGNKASSEASGFGLSTAMSGFSALPAVKMEMEAVFGAGKDQGALRGTVAMDAGFTRTSLESALEARKPIVHIASHFSMNAGDAGRSFLLLGDGSKLSLSDINVSRRLRFRGVELVTLSACSTGLGIEGNGLEVEGLGALIQSKGADSVVSTLWNVSDEATASFMIDFYRGFTRDGLSKAAALQRAQVTMIRSDKSAPFYWAPFMLAGDWT